jgi:hypothetical protein
MNRKNLNRLEMSVRALPQGPPPAAVPDLDFGQLAREAAQAFADQLDRYRRTRDTEAPLDPRERTPDFIREAIQDKPPQDITFADIERLARLDPAAGTAKWAEVKAAAVADLEKGWLAARAVEPFGASAWDRACFLAVRARLHRTWPPRHDAEAVLLDQIAQYEMLRNRWVAILADLTRDPLTMIALRTRGKRPADERSAAAGAATEATRVIDRLHRLIQGTLRTLLGLRRAPAAVVVRQVAQLNVAAGPQMNMNVPPAAGPDRSSDET